MLASAERDGLDEAGGREETLSLASATLVADLPVGVRPINPLLSVPRPVMRAHTVSPSPTMSSIVRLKGAKVSRR